MKEKCIECHTRKQMYDVAEVLQNLFDMMAYGEIRNVRVRFNVSLKAVKIYYDVVEEASDNE